MRFIEKYSKEISIILNNMLNDIDDIEENISSISTLIDDVDTAICYSIFPVLVEIFEDNDNAKLLSLIAKVKAKAMMCKPTDIEIYELLFYLDSLMKISYKFATKKTPTNDEELSTAYKNLCYWNFFSTHSTDAIGFYKSPQFNKPIPVKCKYCSNEVLDFEVKEDNITPINELSFDAYNSQIINRIESLQNLDLMGIADETYILYGSYKCDNCSKENIVIKAHSNYFLSQENYTQLTHEEIQKLDESLNNVIEYNYSNELYSDLLIFSGEYIANLYWDTFGIDCLYPYVRLLNNSIIAYKEFGYEYIKMIVNSSKNAIKKYSGDDIKLLGDIYCEMGKSLGILETITNEEKINAHNFLQKGYEYYLKVFGKDNLQTFYAKVDADYMLAKIDNNNINPLIDNYEFMKNHKEFNTKELLSYGSYIIPLIQEKNIDFAIKLQEDYINDLNEKNINFYHQNNKLSKLYIKACDYPKALELLNFSLNNCVNELGKKIYNDILNDLEIDKNTIDSLKLKRIAQTLEIFGYYYSNTSDYDNSIKHYKNSIKFYNLYQDIENCEYLIESAEIYVELGKVFILNNNQNLANTSFETAIDIYNTCIEITDDPDEFYQVQELLSSVNNLLN